MIEGIIYAIILVFFFIMIYRCLNALNLGHLFKQGRVFEIRFMFVIISLILSYLMCELINKFLSFAGISL
ncbi:MAG: DUF1146 family protein [Anaeroplasmataceae bacterium]